MREIIDNPDAPVCRPGERVQVELPPDWTTPTPWADIAAQLAERRDIVNTRKAARELQRHHARRPLPPVGPDVRRAPEDVIAHIKERLKAKRGRDAAAYRLGSPHPTVEAGVDIDFPVVYRALAGSIPLPRQRGAVATARGAWRAWGAWWCLRRAATTRAFAQGCRRMHFHLDQRKTHNMTR